MLLGDRVRRLIELLILKDKIGMHIGVLDVDREIDEIVLQLNEFATKIKKPEEDAKS